MFCFVFSHAVFMPEHNISSLKQRNNLPTKINKTSLSVEQLSFKAKTMAVKTQSHTFWCICWWMMFNFIIKKCFVRPINSAFFKIANKSGMKDVFVDPRSDLTFFEAVWGSDKPNILPGGGWGAAAWWWWKLSSDEAVLARTPGWREAHVFLHVGGD